VLDFRFRPEIGFGRQQRNEAIGRYTLAVNELRPDLWFLCGRFLRPPVPYRGSLSCPIPGAPSSPLWRLPAWLPSRFFSPDDAGLASFVVEMIEDGGCNPFKDKKLGTVFRWLRFALSRRPLGAG
jgi:hypothetical protein